MKTLHWTSRDLELLPEDGKRYEIIDGELYVAKQPDNAQEYWVVKWRERSIEVYQRQEGILELDRTLNKNDTLQTPLLPGFSCKVEQLFIGIAR